MKSTRLILALGCLALLTSAAVAQNTTGPAPIAPMPADPTIPPPPATPSLTDMAAARPTYRSPILRMASVPNMFGDLVAPSAKLHFSGYDGMFNIVSGTADLPLGGAARRLKIAENNKPIPMDRVYGGYNHYHNAMMIQSTAGNQSASIDRYLVGFEKTFFDGYCSVDIRMPLASEYSATNAFLDIDGGEVGNLNIAMKRLLYITNHSAIGCGLSIDTPTGSEITAHMASSSVTLCNDAVFVSPFIGFVRQPNSRVFQEGILQIDIPLNGNRIIYDTGSTGLFGRWYDQTLLHVDLATGYWLHHNPGSPFLTGLAAMFEVHYTASLSNGGGPQGTLSGDYLDFQSSDTSLVHLTAGLHAEIDRDTTLRVGAVFPVQEMRRRVFDSEITVSLNKYF